MEAINCVIAVPFGIIALFLIFTGWQRWLWFNSHDYQENGRERIRDNYFSTLNIITGFSCIFPIFTPVKLWGFLIPFILLLIVVLTPVIMLGVSFGSILETILTAGKNRDSAISWLGGKDLSTLEWYEYTPFAFVAGWAVYYLVYVSLLSISRIRITSDVVPVWIVLIGLVFGMIVSGILTRIIHKRFS